MTQAECEAFVASVSEAIDIGSRPTQVALSKQTEDEMRLGMHRINALRMHNKLQYQAVKAFSEVSFEMHENQAAFVEHIASELILELAEFEAREGIPATIYKAVKNPSTSC